MVPPQEKDPEQPNHDEHRLVDAVRRMRNRREQWTIVGPTLLGAWAGRWLDQKFHSGVFWSATLVFLGVSAGFYMVWKKMHTV